MEGWVKIGVQRASVLYPNSCYNEPCYIEVQVYFFLKKYGQLSLNYPCYSFLSGALFGVIMEGLVTV